MPLVNCEINLILTLIEDCVISSANGRAKFEIKEYETLCSSFKFINSR